MPGISPTTSALPPWPSIWPGRFGAPALFTRYSRLLIDPNRGRDDPTLVMQLSDGRIVPGNAAVDEAEIEARIERFYAPYHQAIEAAID